MLIYFKSSLLPSVTHLWTFSLVSQCTEVKFKFSLLHHYNLSVLSKAQVHKFTYFCIMRIALIFNFMCSQQFMLTLCQWCKPATWPEAILERDCPCLTIGNVTFIMLSSHMHTDLFANYIISSELFVNFFTKTLFFLCLSFISTTFFTWYFWLLSVCHCENED